MVSRGRVVCDPLMRSSLTSLCQHITNIYLHKEQKEYLLQNNIDFPDITFLNILNKTYILVQEDGTNLWKHAYTDCLAMAEV